MEVKLDLLQELANIFEKLSCFITTDSMITHRTLVRDVCYHGSVISSTSSLSDDGSQAETYVLLNL
jgi:hypothetical protein